ncbi:MAG: hypothetical protein ABIV06_07590 [Thermoanaerobaculia bacterium]
MLFRRWIVVAAIALTAASSVSARADDGLLDETFSTDGLLILSWSGGGQPAQAYVVGSFPDGSLLIAGDVEATAANPDIGFIKVDAQGGVDTGWGTSGRRLVPIDAEPGGDDSVRALAILPDGSAIAAGFSLYYFPDAGSSTYRPALVRLDPAGNPDPAFGDSGVAVIDLPWPTDDFSFQDPAMQPDGKAIYFGYCYDCPLVGDGRSTLILRVGTDGVLDPTFSGDGWIRESTGTLGAFSPSAGALDGAGRIVLFGGDGAGQQGLLRLTASGALDTSFGGGDGIVSFPSPVGFSNPYEFAIDGSSGAIYCSYYSAAGPNTDFSVVQRFAPDGTPDATFGGDGTVELVYQEGIQIESIAVQSDGKILAGGYRRDDGTADLEWMLYRLTPAGILDNSFDGNGRRLVDFGQPAGMYERIHGMTISGGRLVAVGGIRVAGTNRFGIARITSDLIFRDGFERASVGGWGGN